MRQFWLSAAGAVAGLLFFIGPNVAYALDEIYSPIVDYRELSLGYEGSRTFDPRADKNNAQEQALDIEAGITPLWEVETSGGFAKDPGGSLKMQDMEIQNRFQFSEAGENWIDSGMLVAYDFSTQSQQADSLEVKLLLQKDISMITTTANIGFFQDVGSNSVSGGPDYVLLSNTRYRLNEYFQPGVEVQADLGQAHAVGRFGQQQDYVGPAAYGRLFGHLKYQVAYFAGASAAAAQTAARALVEYEFHY